MKRLLPLALLAACAAPAPGPAPQSVRLTETELTLRLTDGTQCTTRWDRAPKGRMPTCGPGFAYAVTLSDRRPNLLRQLFEGVDLALGGGMGLEPMAKVTVTDSTGRDHVFTSPDPARS